MSFLRKQSRFLKAFAAAVAVISLACMPIIQAAPAQAWSPNDFQPGRIIDDALFYDGNAMTTSEVQSFLDAQVPRCTIGDPGRAAGSSWGNTFIASTCLQNLKMTTQSVAANAFCSAFIGSSNDTAASIIAKVGKACGISQKSLLVMLQKEQSLVTDTWPTVTQLASAMGYACPDTAPCDTEKGGFFTQVYNAAWQLQVYKVRPASWNYKPHQNNTIQWHPNAGCGVSNVYIENSATAGLYIYTPYRPNQAALNAGWGTGDGCSTYGNRNFFNYYNAWFGSTDSLPVVRDGIKVIRDRALENGFDYGDPLESRRWIAENGGGWEQKFENGVITESRALYRTFGLPNGKFSEAYIANGGATGPWGFLAGDATGSTVAGSRALATQHGSLIYTVQRGVQYLPSSIYDAWNANGGYSGSLGYPVNSAFEPTPSSASQFFEEGSTIMASGTDATVVTSADLEVWNSLGGYDTIGFYTSDPVYIANQSYRPTEKGSLFFTTSDTIFLANDKILDTYFSASGPEGYWGWPIASKQEVADGISAVEFDGGFAVESPRYGVNFLSRGTTGDPVPLLIDADYSGFASEIRWAAANGITTGHPIEFGIAEFRPFNAISREAMAAFLYRFAGEPEFEPPAESPFLDVPTTGKFYKEIAWLSSTGIATGWNVPGGNEYRPYSPIARNAMAAFLYRYSGSPDVEIPANQQFIDVTSTQPFYTEINWLEQTGISTGWASSDGKAEFRPFNSIARDAMAAFLFRANEL